MQIEARRRRRHCYTSKNGFHALASEHMAGTSQAAGEVARERLSGGVRSESCNKESLLWSMDRVICGGFAKDECWYLVFMGERRRKSMICDGSRLTLDRDPEACVTRWSLASLAVLRRCLTGMCGRLLHGCAPGDRL